MKFIRALRNTFIIIAIFGILTAFIDYQRMVKGYTPIFNSKSYNEKTKVQTYRGLFYVAERTVKVDKKESLASSSNIKYKVLLYDLDIEKVNKINKYTYTVMTKEETPCSNKSKLIYADLNRKYYTYCLDEIKIREKDSKSKPILDYITKNDEIIKELEYEMEFRGLYKDDTTQMYKSEKNVLSNNGLTMYICNKKNINDVYIAPRNVEMIETDFCTYKDDDFYFIWEITEEPPAENTEFPKDEEGNVIPEVFMEDATYRYEFSEPKKDRLFITTPKVRGKEETKTPLMTVLNSKILTLEQLEERGLVFNKIDKQKEKVELEKKRLEEQKKKEEEAKKQAEEQNKKSEEVTKSEEPKKES